MRAVQRVGLEGAEEGDLRASRSEHVDVVEHEVQAVFAEHEIERASITPSASW